MTALTGPPLTAPPHILDLLEPRLRPDSAAPALLDRSIALSYGELDRLTRHAAAVLRGAGLTDGAPVVVHARLSGWAVVAMLAVLRAGGRYVPVDAAFPEQRRERTYRLSGAALALVEPGVAAVPGPWRTVDLGFPAGGDRPSGPVHRGPDAYTYFTSGTTGQPRPVTVPSAALAYSTAARLAYYPEPVSGFLLCSSIAFDSSVAGIFWTLASGGCLVIPTDRPADVVAVRRAALRHRPTHLLMVPSLYALLLRSGDPSGLANLSTVVVAGESCPPALVARHFEVLPDVALHNEYGPTECTVWSTVHRCVPADAAGPTVPIGAPIPGTSVTLRAADGARVPAGEIGEIWIEGPGVATGAGAYATGDLARVGPDGLLRFHGRRDDQLKLGGVRIELAEIEQALADCPGVGAGAVGRAGRDGGATVLVAFVVPAERRVDPRSVRAFLRTRLPAVAVPSRCVVLDALPTQPNGKLDRRALNRWAVSGESPAPASA
ncbi:amino acid adenylation domain-containing protein [Micromonospora sp. NPDC049559]|uniref:amino acid adenylation domain-containing protein n=1 Tax=Micromonospora sp. NPDC049559 TaxID=3155923 RepID=UPI003449D133